jgi:co-chaperonin GroES (HSP10)
MVDIAKKLASSELKRFQPAADYLLIEIHEKGETPGGVVLPEGYKEDGPAKGTVVKAGPGLPKEGGRWPMESKEGDVVYLAFGRQPLPLTLDGKKYFLVRDDAILARSVK